MGIPFNSTTFHTTSPLWGAVIMSGASYYSVSSLHELTHLQCHSNPMRLALLKFFI